MCGIAGIIYRNGDGHEQVGRDMTRMLQAMKHRGPDSTGYALYRPDTDGYVMHVKLAEANGHQDFELAERLRRRQQQLRLVVPESAPLRRVLRIVNAGGVVPIVATVEDAATEIRAAA
jgi:glutamate synthase domain-containing protein 1